MNRADPKPGRDTEGRRLAFTGITLQAGKYYRNGLGDLRGPMRDMGGNTFCDEYGGVYRINGHQYSHHIESAGNLVREEKATDAVPSTRTTKGK